MEELSVTQPLPEADLEVNDIPAEESLPRQYIRIVYAKTESIKFISHHDEFRLWERTLRRADLPLLYKQGFNPQPHMQFASPLGVGITGERELLDITLSPPVPLDELRSALEAKLGSRRPSRLADRAGQKTASVQGLLIGADYTILIYAAPGEIEPAAIESASRTFSPRRRSGANASAKARPTPTTCAR